MVCLGLGGAGKSAMLATLLHEPPGGLAPTRGFAAKTVPLARVALAVKELAGGAAFRPYWAPSLAGDDAQGLLFAVAAADASSRAAGLAALDAVLAASPRAAAWPVLVLLLARGAAPTYSADDDDSASVLAALPHAAPGHVMVRAAGTGDGDALRRALEAYCAQFGFV